MRCSGPLVPASPAGSSGRPCSTSSSVGESAIITDSKGELYADTAELFRRHGYEVKVFNLVNPEHGDSWNCMSDLGGDTLLAQVLTNVIIGKHQLWENRPLLGQWGGESPQSPHSLCGPGPHPQSEEKNLPAVSEMLIRHSAAQLTALFERLPLDHPARGPYRLFSQASDTVRSGIVLGLGDPAAGAAKRGGGPYSPPQRY